MSECNVNEIMSEASCFACLPQEQLAIIQTELLCRIYNELAGEISGYTPGSVIFAGADGSLSEDNANFFYDETTKQLQVDTIRLNSMTPGSVLFAGTSGDVSQDNANLFWDNTNNRLGIGTVIPSFSLEVSGKIGINSTQILFLPDQTNFLGTLILGSGGGALSHSSGSQGQGNTFVGLAAGRDTTTGSNNTVVGYNAFRQNTTGSSNSAFGIHALLANTTGGSNSAFGRLALTANTTGSENSAFGYNALLANTTGIHNNAFGFHSLVANTTGEKNAAFGRNTLQANTVGINNSAFGNNALFSNTNGNNNTAVGIASLNANTTGSDNVGIGHDALIATTSGGSNVGVGYRALFTNTTGSDNTAVGHSAGEFIADGISPNATSSFSLFLGTNSKASAAAETNQIVIGYNAIGSGSNTVTLGNTSITTTVLRGNVGIGTTAPTAGNLVVNGSIVVGGIAAINKISKVLQGSSALDFTNTLAGTDSGVQTITVTGAAEGDPVYLGLPHTAANTANICWTFWVSSANTVSIKFHNNNTVTAVDLNSLTYKVFVFQQ